MVQPGTPSTQRAGSADYVSQRLDDLQRQIREIGPALMAAVGPAITDLQTQQATLTAQQATLTAQQATLTTAVANIATLVGEQVSVGIATVATATAWTSATTYATKASTSITVPSGYTRALVVGVATTVFQDSAPNSFQSRLVLGGDNGTELNGLANLNASHSPQHAVSLTSVSGTISVALQVKSGVASSVTTGRIAQVGGFALFLR